MLIAISGSQGTGKTTILEYLDDMGYNTIQRKTARSVLDDENLTLDDVNSDINTKMWFQDKLLSRKFADETSDGYHERDSELTFTERTYADLFTYALITLGPINKCDTWLNEYYDKCKTYQRSYHQINYIPAGHFTVDNDGVRSVNEHYSRLVDESMLHNTRRMQHHTRQLFVLGNSNRIDTILQNFKQN